MLIKRRELIKGIAATAIALPASGLLASGALANATKAAVPSEGQNLFYWYCNHFYDSKKALAEKEMAFIKASLVLEGNVWGYDAKTTPSKTKSCTPIT